MIAFFQPGDGRGFPWNNILLKIPFTPKSMRLVNSPAILLSSHLSVWNRGTRRSLLQCELDLSPSGKPVKLFPNNFVQEYYIFFTSVAVNSSS